MIFNFLLNRYERVESSYRDWTTYFIVNEKQLGVSSLWKVTFLFVLTARRRAPPLGIWHCLRHAGVWECMCTCSPQYVAGGGVGGQRSRASAKGSGNRMYLRASVFRIPSAASARLCSALFYPTDFFTPSFFRHFVFQSDCIQIEMTTVNQGRRSWCMANDGTVLSSAGYRSTAVSLLHKHIALLRRGHVQYFTERFVSLWPTLHEYKLLAAGSIRRSLCSDEQCYAIPPQGKVFKVKR